MADEIAAIPIAAVEGVMATNDGSHILVATKQPDGQPTILAIPPDQAMRMIDCLADGETKCRKLSGDDRHPVFVATWWALGPDEASGTVVLTLTFGAGGQLSFALPHPMPMAILETLQLGLGVSTPPTPQKPPN